jgi:NAD(P)-dependent dehydrogenase (short-subunit alcohol dehydrogenase family)
MPKLDDKVAIVTGGAHGIGKAICEAFAEADATVFVVDLDEKAGEACAAEIRANGGKATFCRGGRVAAGERNASGEAGGGKNGAH